jgi:type I restriction enzyme R subunit
MDLRRKIEWLKETRMAVVVSEEQGEIEKFERWALDIVPHRTLMKSGFETPDGKTLGIDAAFKREDHPFRVVFVCAMWLTGVDVPSLSTLYLDKPLKAHTLMQAIARANRINEGKNNGLIVDYCGILKNLREALATFATGGGAGTGGAPEPPVKPDEELLGELAEAIDHTRAFLKDRGFALETVTLKTGFDKIAAIKDAKDVINQSEETRKRFEIQARMVFKKFKACLNIKAVNDLKAPHDAINIIYKKLQGDRDTADISKIIQELHEVVDHAVEAREGDAGVDDYLYDMSKIDFGLLQEEFAKKKHKNTTVYCLKEAIEKKLARMLKRNPLRIDFNRRYQEIIKGYNAEKNRSTIEKTFEELMTYYRQLSEEEKRAAIEGLTEEQLAVFDLLLKPQISRADREKVKQIAGELLEGLKAEKLKVENWREKEVTKAAVKTFIYNYLYDENTGLPDPFYSIDDVEQKTGVVFDHVFMQYQDNAHSVYAGA